MFDSVAQSSPRHGSRMLIQKGHQHTVVDPFTNFTEHPADSFLNQIMFVVYKLFGNYKRFVGPALFDEIERCKHGNAPLPQRF